MRGEDPRHLSEEREEEEEEEEREEERETEALEKIREDDATAPPPKAAILVGDR